MALVVVVQPPFTHAVLVHAVPVHWLLMLLDAELELPFAVVVQLPFTQTVQEPLSQFCETDWVFTVLLLPPLVVTLESVLVQVPLTHTVVVQVPLLHWLVTDGAPCWT